MITHCPHDSSIPLELHWPEHPGVEEHIERQPPRLGDFAIKHQRRAARVGKDERTDENRRKYGSPRGEIIQATDEGASRELEPDLLPCLPPGGIDQPGIAGTPSPARKSQVSGPPVSLAVCPADQKNAVGIWSENDGDRRKRTIGVFNESGTSGGEARREPRDPAQCE